MLQNGVPTNWLVEIEINPSDHSGTHDIEGSARLDAGFPRPLC